MAGDFPADKKLPTIRSLASSFNASTKTVQKAINELKADGVIESKHGKGVFIRSSPSRLNPNRRIGVVYAGPADYLESAWPQQVMRPFRESLQRASLSLVPCPLAKFEPLGVVEQLDQLDLAGIVLFELNSESLILEIKQLRLPMISIDSDACHLGISSVVFDNAYGGFLATNYLISRGHRNVAILRPWIIWQIGSNPYVDKVDDARILGHRIAMQHAGLPCIEEQFHANGNVKPHLRGLLARRPAVTGVFCVGDWPALALTQIAQEQGLSIPQDVSVIGFGESGAEFAPGRRLTSIQVDPEGMGTHAAQMIQAEMAEQAELPTRTILPVRLAVHDSVGVAPGAIQQTAPEARVPS